jgi:ferredoxin--NADP+ reductase
VLCLFLFLTSIGMMPGIQDMLQGVAKKKGLDYDEWLKGLKAKKQWHVEVY